MVCDWNPNKKNSWIVTTLFYFFLYIIKKDVEISSLFFSQLPMRFPGGIASFSRESMRDGRASQSTAAAASQRRENGKGSSRLFIFFWRTQTMREKEEEEEERERVYMRWLIRRPEEENSSKRKEESFLGKRKRKI
jgi:hypothetical protein